MTSNFTFLEPVDEDLVKYGTDAERYYASDPEVCVFKLRQFGEAVTTKALHHFGERWIEDKQYRRLKQLEGRFGVTDRVLANLHALRKVGNRASHADSRVDNRDAATQLRNARAVAVWYVAEFHDPDIKVPGFTLPSTGQSRRDAELEKELQRRLDEESKRTEQELAALREQLSRPQVATQTHVGPLVEAIEPRSLRDVLYAALQDFTDEPDDERLEPVDDAADEKVRLLPLPEDYAAVVVASPSGDAFVIAWVAERDDAVAWARPRRFEIHPVLGSLQTFDPAEAEAAVADVQDAAGERQKDHPKDTGTPLFEAFDDDALLQAGLPAPLIPAVREVRSDDAFDQLAPHLPEEAADILYGLASGYTLEEALAEMQRTRREPVEEAEWGVALEHPDSKRRFQLHPPGTSLEDALKGSLEAWRVYLHPDQSQLVHMQARGPVKVLGGAGTGKTVALMHRAAHLARNVFNRRGDRLFVTTFTRNLAIELKRNIWKLVPERHHRERIDVQNLHRWAVAHVERAGHKVNIADPDLRERLWRQALHEAPTDHDPAFVRAEWRDVVQAHDVETVRDYLLADRRGRGIGLTRGERRALWPTLARYRRLLEQQKRVEFDDVVRQARKLITSGVIDPPYRAVLVDELQDFGPGELKLLRAMVPESDNDMFLVGDAHQRIYQRVAVLSRCGIEARGARARRLRVNYRSTAQVARWALARLGMRTYDDLDAGRDTLRGYHALRTGVATVHRHFESAEAERAFLVQQVQRWLRERPAEAICVTARSHDPLADYQAALNDAGIQTHELDAEGRSTAEGVRLATMHRMKGLEFPCVFIAGVQKGLVPKARDDESAEDVGSSDDSPAEDGGDSAADSIAARREATERSLLYVAATRARDELVVSGWGEPSPFADMFDGPVAESGAPSDSGVGRVSEDDTRADEESTR